MRWQLSLKRQLKHAKTHALKRGRGTTCLEWHTHVSRNQWSATRERVVRTNVGLSKLCNRIHLSRNARMNDDHANESIPSTSLSQYLHYRDVQFAHAVNSRKSRTSLLLDEPIDCDERRLLLLSYGNVRIYDAQNTCLNTCFVQKIDLSMPINFAPFITPEITF